MVEEIIGRLPNLTGSQLGRLEDEIRRERQRRAPTAGEGQGTPNVREDTAPPVTEVQPGPAVIVDPVSRSE